MPHFHPIYDTALTLLALAALILGALLPGPMPLRGYLVLFGLVLMGYELSKVFLALHLLERRETLFDPEPDGGEEVTPETAWPVEVTSRPEYEVVTPIRRAA